MTQKIRIAGPPGTGKTTKLVQIYYDHIVENKYSPADIIVISHTNTAANHIKYILTTVYKNIKKKQEERFLE